MLGLRFYTLAFPSSVHTRVGEPQPWAVNYSNRTTLMMYGGSTHGSAEAHLLREMLVKKVRCRRARPSHAKPRQAAPSRAEPRQAAPSRLVTHALLALTTCTPRSCKCAEYGPRECSLITAYNMEGDGRSLLTCSN